MQVKPKIGRWLWSLFFIIIWEVLGEVDGEGDLIGILGDGLIVLPSPLVDLDKSLVYVIPEISLDLPLARVHPDCGLGPLLYLLSGHVFEPRLWGEGRPPPRKAFHYVLCLLVLCHVLDPLFDDHRRVALALVNVTR